MPEDGAPPARFVAPWAQAAPAPPRSAASAARRLGRGLRSPPPAAPKLRRFRFSTPAGFWKPKVVDGLLLNMQPGRPPTNNDLPREVKAAAGATADEIVQRLQTAARQLGCKAPPALPDDPAALGLPGPSAGSGRAYAPPERRLGRLEALPWPQELASGRPQG